jgi:hypothetical protein
MSRLSPALFSSLLPLRHRVDENLLRAKLPLPLTSLYMELTKEYFDEQLKNLATKDDLKSLATRDELDNLKSFVQTNMVTKQELDELREELPTRADFSKLQQSVDGIARQFQEQRQELMVGAARSERMEAWIIKAAGKIGVEYKP